MTHEQALEHNRVRDEAIAQVRDLWNQERAAEDQARLARNHYVKDTREAVAEHERWVASLPDDAQALVRAGRDGVLRELGRDVVEAAMDRPQDVQQQVAAVPTVKALVNRAFPGPAISAFSRAFHETAAELDYAPEQADAWS